MVDDFTSLLFTPCELLPSGEVSICSAWSVPLFSDSLVELGGTMNDDKGFAGGGGLADTVSDMKKPKEGTETCLLCSC